MANGKIIASPVSCDWFALLFLDQVVIKVCSPRCSWHWRPKVQLTGKTLDRKKRLKESRTFFGQRRSRSWWSYTNQHQQLLAAELSLQPPAKQSGEKRRQKRLPPPQGAGSARACLTGPIWRRGGSNGGWLWEMLRIKLTFATLVFWSKCKDFSPPKGWTLERWLYIGKNVCRRYHYSSAWILRVCVKKSWPARRRRVMRAARDFHFFIG